MSFLHGILLDLVRAGLQSFWVTLASGVVHTLDSTTLTDLIAVRDRRRRSPAEAVPADVVAAAPVDS